MPQPILPTIHSQNYDPVGTTVITSNAPSIPQATSGTQYIAPLEDDPLWMKCKSVVFHGAGRVQSKLGKVTGVDGFTHRGRAWESWATNTSEHAEFMIEHGASSRLHGWMGYFGKMLGHDDEVSETPLDHTNDENDYSRCRSSV